jgi:hypothetical protein
MCWSADSVSTAPTSRVHSVKYDRCWRRAVASSHPVPACVPRGTAHLKNWRALARHHGRREYMTDIIQAVAGLLSHEQTATKRSDLQS